MTSSARKTFNAAVGVAALSLLGMAVRSAVSQKMDAIAPRGLRKPWVKRCSKK